MNRLIKICSAFAVLAPLVALAAGSAAHAQSIGVAFGNGVQPTDSPGVVAAINFNDILGGNGTNVALNDSTGTTTSALLTFNASGSYGGFAPTNTPNTGTNAMYTQGLYGSGTDPTFTVTNIPYASYSVYVYANDGDTGNGSTVSVTDGTTTYYSAQNGNNNSAATVLTLVSSTNPASPTVGTGFYEFFTGTSPSFTITALGSQPGVFSQNLYGFQIVATAGAPEPASLLPALLGGIPLLTLASRRRRAGAGRDND